MRVQRLTLREDRSINPKAYTVNAVPGFTMRGVVSKNAHMCPYSCPRELSRTPRPLEKPPCSKELDGPSDEKQPAI